MISACLITLLGFPVVSVENNESVFLPVDSNGIVSLDYSNDRFEDQQSVETINDGRAISNNRRSMEEVLSTNRISESCLSFGVDADERKDKKGNFWNFFALGAFSSYRLEQFPRLTMKEDDTYKLDEEDSFLKSNFDIDFTLHTPILTLRYTIAQNEIREKDFNTKYSNIHVDLYNLGIRTGWEDFSMLFFPTLSYSRGDDERFSYRSLDFALGGFELSNQHRVFWDKTTPSKSYTHTISRYTFGNKFIEKIALVRFYRQLWEAEESFIMNAGELLGTFLIPYATLFFQQDKYTTRQFDKVVSEKKTGYNFGASFGFGLHYTLGYKLRYANLTARLKALVGYSGLSGENGYSRLGYELGINLGILFKR